MSKRRQNKVQQWCARVGHVLHTLLCIFSAIYLSCFAAFAAGLSIPNNAALKVNTGTIDTEDVLVASGGSLSVTTGQMNVSGDWDIDSSGIFSSGTGLITFDGTTAQQLLDSGGTTNSFYRLVHSGTQTLQLDTSLLDINNDFTNSAGTFDANGLNITIAGDWTNAANYQHGSNTVTFDGTNQMVTGDTTWFNFTKAVTTADTMTFDNTAEQQVEGTLTFNGAPGQLLTLVSDVNTVEWELNLRPIGAQDVQYVDVRDSNATGVAPNDDGLTIVARNSTDSGNNTNWAFDGATITWDGSLSTDWSSPFNWDLGVVPLEDDYVVIPDVSGASGNDPIMPASDTITVRTLTIESGGILDANSSDLIVTGTLILASDGTFRLRDNDLTIGTNPATGLFNNEGNIELYGLASQSFTFLGGTAQDVDSGTYTYIGDGSGLSQTRDIYDFGATDYFNLTINDEDGVKNTFVTTDNLTLAETLTVTAAELDISSGTDLLTVGGTINVNGGTLTATSGTVDVAQDVIISDGDFVAPATGGTFTLAGDFTRTGGTYTHSQGQITLDGSSQLVSGSTTFWAFYKQVTSADTITFEAGAETTVLDDLVMTGTSGNVLTIVSTDPGTPVASLLTLPPEGSVVASARGIQTLSYLDVSDNDASNGTELIARNSTDSGGNTNWDFDGATITWDGSNSTDYGTQNNWDKGVVPTIYDDVIIADTSGTTGNQPILDTGYFADTLTINASATLTLTGNSYNVTSTFDNEGTFILQGGETTTFGGGIDVDSGTFRYVGDADGVNDTFTIKNFDQGGSLVDYYNLVINDTAAPSDLFSVGADLYVVNNVTVTDGALLIGANAFDVDNDITVNGGTLNASSATSIDLDGNMTMTSGSFEATSNTMTVAGDWSVTGGTFVNNSGTVTLDGAGQSMIGSSTFYTLSKAVTTADTLTFDNTGTQTITNLINLQGNGVGNLLSLVSDVGGSQFDLNLTPGGIQTISDVDVQDSRAGSLTLVGRSDSVDSGNNDNWAFGNVTLYWDGDISTDWSTAGNWNLGLSPLDGDTSIIVNNGTIANQPVLTTVSETGDLTLRDTDATLSLSGWTFDASGILSNAGTIIMQGDEDLSIATNDTDSGTFRFVGDGAGGTSDFTLVDVDGTSGLEYYDIHLNLDGDENIITSADIYIYGDLTIFSGDFDISTGTDLLTISGTITTSGGTFIGTNGAIDANGDVVISSGSFVAPTTGQTFTLAGSFDNTGNGFVNSSGEVEFDTLTTATILGSTTFYDFTTTAGGKQFNFESGETQSISNDLLVNGGTVNIIFRATSDDNPGSPDWTIDVPGAENVNALDLQDSNATGGDITCLNCVDSGDNDEDDPSPHWVFAFLRFIAPGGNRTIDETPVMIGNAPIGYNIYIEDGDGDVVATAVGDSNGLFRVQINEEAHTAVADGGDAAPPALSGKTVLDLGLNELVPKLAIDNTAGTGSGDLNVVAAPTASQQPIILSPENNTRLYGDSPIYIGEALANQSINVWAQDSLGNLDLMTVASGTVESDGSFSVSTTTPLTKGSVQVSVVVDEVSSDLFTYVLTDPFGVVFDSSSNKALADAVVTIYRASDDGIAELSDCDSNGNVTTLRDLNCDDVNPFTTEADGVYSFVAASGADYYMVVEETGYEYPSELEEFPDGRTIVTGSKGESFTVGSVVLEIDQPMDGNQFLLRIEKTANKAEVRIGDIVTYSILIENLSQSNSVKEFYIEDLMPGGFKYVQNRVLLDGVPITEPLDVRPINFYINEILPGAKRTLRYQMVVGSGVTVGKYKNVAQARYRDTGVVISNQASDEVSVVLDPLFDLGTIIGKVFLDRNENGIQDEPDYRYMDREEVVEHGLSNVQIMTEDGTTITTDQNGLFSLPGLTPGRHLFRLVDRTLPEGAYLTTDKVVIVDVTKGLSTKVNFGVNIDNDRLVGEDYLFFRDSVELTQHQGNPEARLHVDAFQDQVLMHEGIPLEKIEFRIFTNYAAFIETWTLEIFDRGTKKSIRSFHGDRYNMGDPILWDGRDEEGNYIDPRRKYAYQLTVEDSSGEWDQTDEIKLPLERMSDKERENWELEKETPEQRLERYQAWVKEAKNGNSIDKQSIRLDGERITINRVNTRVNAIYLYKDGQLYMDIPIPEKHGLTARELMAGDQVVAGDREPIEFVLPKGEYTIEVVAPEGGDDEGVKAVALEDGTINTRYVRSRDDEDAAAAAGTTAVSHERYAKNFKVGEDYLTFVALGDAKIGYNFNSKNVEEVTREDQFKDGFWNEGRLAYFLKGKIKGKYLVQSSYDSDRDQKAIFGGLDEDKYYPIYGDASTVDRTAADTQGKLFLLVEWDKSEVIWGNYAVDLDDTEFAKFSRALYGGKVEYESLKQTRYGVPRTKAVVFHANLQQLPAHNEFLSTGGSLYYLKHSDVIEGSDSIVVEVRDAVTGLVKSTKEMVRGADYEISYSEGRILFWQPVSMMMNSGSIISSDTFDGDPMYIVADYEYEVQDKLREATRGGRIQQAVNNNVVVGGTYVSETQDGKNYEMRGIDSTLFLGLDTQIKAEYADTLSEAGGNFISTDGGINFTQIATGSTERSSAYGLSGDTRLFNRVGASAYYKNIENTFATASTTSQQGKEMYGLDLTFDLTPVTRLTSSYSVQQLLDTGNVQTQIQVGGNKTTTTSMQLVHEARRLRITAEYRRRDVEQRVAALDDDNQTLESTLAIQAEYAVNDRVDLSITQQNDLTDATKQITTIAGQARVTDNLTLSASQSFGDTSQATKIGAEANVTDSITLKSELVQSGESRDASMSVGGEVKLSDKFAVDTTYTVNRNNESGDFQTVKVTGKSSISDKLAIDTSYALTTGEDDSVQERTFQVVGATDINDNVSVNTKAALTETSDGKQSQTVGVGGKANVALGDNTAIDAAVSLDSSAEGQIAQTVQLAGATKINDTDLKAGVGMSDAENLGGKPNTDLTAEATRNAEDGTSKAAVAMNDSVDGESTSVTLADDRKLTDTLRLVNERTFTSGVDDQTNQDKYGLKRVKDGREAEVSVTRQLAQKPNEVSRSNIYGLSGDVDDKTALQFSYERGRVLNLDGSRASRNVLSAGAGYVEQDPETGEERLKASVKVEYRKDIGDIDRQQWLLYQSAEGKLSDAATVFSKIEISQTRNLDLDVIEAEHREIILGAAYRPLEFDRLNLIASYSYRDNVKPEGQESVNSDIEQVNEQVVSLDAIYDINSKWQLAERFALRITEEKVQGFDFTRTHTWLMVHRLNYFINRDWKTGVEYRMLTQNEAEDRKQGFLLEVTRQMGEFAELGFGYNFTDFDDDVTQLDYSSGGPFLRVTGKLYDRSPEERARAEARWLEERISKLAWQMVQDELNQESSPVVEELNQLFFAAEVAQDLDRLEEAQQLYKDIVMAGQMMYEEAAAYIRSQIEFEEEMKEAYERAQQYYEQGELIKARKLWQSIIENSTE